MSRRRLGNPKRSAKVCGGGRSTRFAVFTTVFSCATVLLIAGCSSSRPRFSTTKNVERIKEYIADAESFTEQNRFDDAQERYERAAKVVRKGIRLGRSKSARRRFREYDTRINKALAALEIKKDRYARRKAEEDERKKSAELVAMAKKKGESGKKKKTVKKENPGLKQVDESLLDKDETPKKKKPDNTDLVPPPPSKKAGEGEKPAPPKKVVPPSQPVTVVRVWTRGKYAFALVRIYNKDKTRDRRIARISGQFKDAGNGVLFEDTGRFAAKGFNDKAADPYEQKDGLTIAVETHRVPAGGTFDAVIMGEDSRPDFVRRVAKCSVSVLYSGNDETVFGSGPSGAAAGGGVGRLNLE